MSGTVSVTELPPDEELEFPEILLTSAALKAAGHHLGRQCAKANNNRKTKLIDACLNYMVSLNGQSLFLPPGFHGPSRLGKITCHGSVYNNIYINHSKKFGQWNIQKHFQFMLCKGEERDPRKCLKDGRDVSRCTFDFFFKIRDHCNESYTNYWTCLDTRAHNLSRCRETQGEFDRCVLDKLGWVRPELGNLSRTQIVKTDRPVPKQKILSTPEPTYVPDIPKDLPKSKTGSRQPFLA